MIRTLLLGAASTLTLAGLAQSTTPANMAGMPGMSAPSSSPDPSFLAAQLQHSTSGTSAEPASIEAPMLMTMQRGWMLMLHGNGFVTELQQQASAPRNRDKLFSTNWTMLMASHAAGSRGQVTLRTMLSLEPATITGRQFPELFQQGETAFGSPIVDGQHPHDFFMELAAFYDLRLSRQTLLTIYAAPVGDPAIGPIAYPHRASAADNPLATLGHHQQDSTHIALSVLTAGLTWNKLRLELSGFHGAEPTEQRWQLLPSPNGLAPDSYSARLTYAPTPHWSMQYSLAHITSPEALYPGEDQQRQTASVLYNRAFSSTATLDASLVWGRTRSLSDQSKQNSYLAEALLTLHRSNHLSLRVEDAGRSNELLLSPGSPLPAGFVESPIGHVQAYSLGLDHDLPTAAHLSLAPGVQFTSDTAPRALQAVYGSHPFSVALFLRLRLVPGA
ncbi:MAG: hypothetical protein KGK08_05245 [Acidobacteriota bacterium]|nr:hypothetical protein [Acidobacteriota bacterium]